MNIIETFKENITIKGTDECPLFRASDVGETLGISSIRQYIRDFNNNEKILIEMDSSGGKHPVNFLTARGLYKLLFHSKTEIACNFQNWVIDIIEHTRLNGYYVVNKENKFANKKIITNKNFCEENLDREIDVDTEYIFKYEIDTETDIEILRSKIKKEYLKKSEFLDKIDFLSSVNEHLYLENKELEKNKEYLKMELDDKNLLLRKNHTNSNELKNKLDLLLKEIKKNNSLIEEKMNSSPSSNKESLAQPHQTYQPRLTTGFNQQLPTLGPRLQKINPETLQLIKVYESVTEAMNENINIKRPSIMKAISENTIYCGFRWLLVERNLDPNVIHNIEPTVQIQQQNIGYIAKLNSEKSTILNVYLDRKTAAKLNGYKSISALDNPVKNGTITNGHYYVLYEKCEPELIADFEEKLGGQPLLYKNGLGQFDASNNMVNEFSCKYECLRTLKMSDKTLTKALENKTPYNGFTYKELGSKLSVYL